MTDDNLISGDWSTVPMWYIIRLFSYLKTGINVPKRHAEMWSTIEQSLGSEEEEEEESVSRKHTI